MDINTKTSYIVIGTGINSDNTLINALELPAPNTLPVTDQYLADAERGATGVMQLQQIGRTMVTGKLGWASLPNKILWKLNRWFEDNGYVFYMKYFDHLTGKIKIHQFYKGFSDQVSPSGTQEIIDGISVPTHYKNVSLSVIDVGEDDVVVLKTIGV